MILWYQHIASKLSILYVKARFRESSRPMAAMLHNGSILRWTAYVEHIERDVDEPTLLMWIVAYLFLQAFIDGVEYNL